MVPPAIALAFIPFFITLLIRYRHYFVLFYRAVILRKFQDYVTGISREERAFQYIMTHAVAGDTDNILHTLDTWCYTTEYVSYVGPKKGKILERLLYEKEPVSVLELGTHCGYATIRIARSLSLKARLYSVEMDQRNATVADKIIRLAGFDEDLIELIVEPSDELIPHFRERYGVDKVDFVFMDHWKRSYLRDLKLLEDYNLLEEGCVILADNVLFPGAPRFLQYVKTCGKYRWKLHRAHLEYFRSIRDGMAELIYIGVK